MAKKTKTELIAEGKELGLNLNMKMSIYELEHRIEDAKANQPDAPKETKSTRRGKGEY